MQNNKVEFYLYLDAKKDEYILTVTKTDYHQSKGTNPFKAGLYDSVEFYKEPMVEEKSYHVAFEYWMDELHKNSLVDITLGKKPQLHTLLNIFYRKFILKEFKHDALANYEFRRFANRIESGEEKVHDYPQSEYQTFKGEWTHGGWAQHHGINLLTATHDFYADQLKYHAAQMKDAGMKAEALEAKIAENVKAFHELQGNHSFYIESSGTAVVSPNSPEQLSWKLPGINERVKHPKTGQACYYDDIIADGDEDVFPLRQLVMHINDEHKWTREQIADWLETLDVDLAFKIKENEDEVSN